MPDRPGITIATTTHWAKMEPRAELVLSLHGIGTPPPWVPADEVPYWISAAAFADFVTTAAAWMRRTEIPVLVTFDDGNRSDLLVAAPLLKDHAIPGAFFVCTGRLGQADWLNAQDVRDLAALGFAVGSHGVDHVPWTSLTGAPLANEVGGSRAALSALLGQEVTSTAIPFGAYNRRVLAAIRHAGYTRVFNSDPGLSPRGAWMQRRWTYRQGEPFDLDAMVQSSRTVRHRIVVGAKGLIKAWR